MSKEMVISANPHETRVAILEEGQLCEYYVERENEFNLVGSIYKGRVTRVLPGMQSAFVDIGLDGDAFLYVTDFLEEIEELDHAVAPGGGPVAAPELADTAAVAEAELAAPDAAAAPSDAPSLADSSSHPGGAAPLAGPGAPSGAPSYDRPRYENRSRDSRNFGGRSGGRGGRDSRGGHGRFGGRGDGRHYGSGRHGRDLPPSKYASHDSYADRGGGAPEGHVDVILPGESLAKFRDRAPAVPVEESAPAAPNDSVAAPISSSPAPESTGVGATHEPTRAAAAFSRSALDVPTLTGIEPLPGETLSKWRAYREPAAVPVPSPAEAETPLEEKAADHQEDDREQEAQIVHEAASVDEAHGLEELSEEEAAALAEHVAEAQIEEEAREAERRNFAAADESAETGVLEAEEAAAEAGEEEASEEESADAAADEEEDLAAEIEAEEDDAEADAASETAAEMQDEADAEAAAQAEGGAVPPAHAEAAASELAASAPEDSPLAHPEGIPSSQEQQPWQARVRDDFRARMRNPARRGGRDRGRRDDRDRGRRPQHGFRGAHHRFPPRRPQLIADMLKQGQEIIVQIAKEPLGKKGARITSHIALPGRYLVYMPTLGHTGVSRKIASAEERARLRHLVTEAKGTAGGGFIVRTAAAKAAPEEIRADVEFLTHTWSEIKSHGEQRKVPSLLHRDLNIVERMLRDYMNADFSAVWVDSEEEFTKVVEFMSRFQPALVNRVKLYTKENPVFEEFGIQQEIDKGLRPKVWLKSGGYIVINHTEALVAIDVNTGKFVGKGSTRLEDTIVRTNVEAVKEIVRQMRLRDLGGIIVIDFIDMEERRNREKVMAALEDALRADRAPSKVLRFNEFGLVAITRKRTKQALERTLCQPCPYCTGSGMVKSVPTLCYEIQTEARKMAPEIPSGTITLRVHPEISKALKTREASLIEELERWTGKSAIIQADPTLHWEQYDIY